MSVPVRQIRAVHTDDTITVYQAYPARIARPALATGRFVDPFKRERMTWIKPSFLWMMYRCGYATKPDQEHVLAVEITRAAFEWALANSCLSHYSRDHYQSREDWSARLRASPVRVQWDPERSPHLAALPHRSLQVGLSGEAVHRYVDDWIVRLTDVTDTAHAVRDRLRAGDETGAAALLPREWPYPLPAGLAVTIGASG
ncbi:DUF4291 domain-containing protein [Polymorphospora lycopeni]|uniref:DUF4291 domain-containing protein n=1 Tax=Polymorphospora lycopeni TaxID=3140240 RepID=A0ABV5CM39_9ACTN